MGKRKGVKLLMDWQFIKIRDSFVPSSEIESIQYGTLIHTNQFFVTLYFKNKKNELIIGIPAIDLAMRCCPQIFEGDTQFKFAKRAWAFHNLIAHPLMQILAFFGLTKLGLRVHDATIPRPKVT